jgi:EmrB/QacA subfamily drug resistance transporter
MRQRSSVLATALIAGAFFMENLDGTVIASALPRMAASLHTGAVSLNIGISAYFVALAVFIPISGWVADRIGSRSVFASAIAVFTFASLLCGLCHSLTQFTLLRIVQGIGGSMMVPVGRLIILRSSPKDRLTQAIGYITWPALTALILGPPIGGFVTTYFSWRWIFVINLPLGLIAFALSLYCVDNQRSDSTARIPFHWSSFMFAGLASAGIVYALELLGHPGIRWKLPATILIISVVGGVLAVLAARRSPYSLIDFQSMKIKSYRLSIYGANGFRIAVSVLPFLLPLMFQIGFHLSAFVSGLYLLALFAGDLCMKPFIIQALRRFGFRRILIVNGVIAAGSVALCATLAPATPPALIAAVLFFHGACRSLEFTCMTTLAYTEIESARMSRANGFLSAVNQLSLGVGVALGALALRVVTHVRGSLYTSPEIRDFHIVILCMAILALSPVLDSLNLSHDAGSVTSGNQIRSMQAA